CPTAPPRPSLFPYTTLFRSRYLDLWFEGAPDVADVACWFTAGSRWHGKGSYGATDDAKDLNVPKVRAIAEVSAKHPHPFVPSKRSEEHMSELQSRSDLVCRL